MICLWQNVINESAQKRTNKEAKRNKMMVEKIAMTTPSAATMATPILTARKPRTAAKASPNAPTVMNSITMPAMAAGCQTKTRTSNLKVTESQAKLHTLKQCIHCNHDTMSLLKQPKTKHVLRLSLTTTKL